MNRHEATRRVMDSLIQTERTALLSYVAPDGSRPIVVCTPDEYLSSVTQRVALLGGSANVVLAEVNRFRVLEIHSQPDAGGRTVEGINADISMGMFYIRAQNHDSSKEVFHVGGVSASLAAQQFEYA